MRRAGEANGGAAIGSVAPAATLHRLAVLLEAGIPPATAWGYLADGEEVARIAESAARGIPIPESIASEAERPSVLDAASWRVLAAAWELAVDTGAPLASTLRSIAGSLRDVAQTRREIEVALAGPVATSRLVMTLPLLGVGLGALLGFDALRTALTTPLGLTAIAVGAGLMMFGVRWSRRMIAAAAPADPAAGIEFDLRAIAISGGAPPARSRETVVSVMARYGIAPQDSSAADQVLELSERAGVAAAELLRTEADEARRRARSEGARQAQSLGIRLLVPLGVCVLPAFMLLGVLPLVMTIAGSSFSAE